MITVNIKKPIKYDTRYEIRCVVTGTDTPIYELKHRLKTFIKCYGGLTSTTVRLGFETKNFKINHNEVWDSIYPLAFWMNLLYNFGSTYFSCKDYSARFIFDYPIPYPIRDFYLKRAESFGFDIDIEAQLIHEYSSQETRGDALAFGGGKDSRLILGMHRELEINTDVFSADLAGDMQGLADIENLNVVKALSGKAIDRYMPALMSMPKSFHLGKALGEAMLEKPWQQYYEWVSPNSIKEISEVLAAVGIEMDISVPVVVLPYNLIQKILFERYPELYKGQVSVFPGDKSEKNLHVSLLKDYHAIDFSDHCSPEIFRALLKKFVDQQLFKKGFGYRNYREVINREMRSIISRKLGDQLYSEIRSVIPDSWNAEWIDYIHGYIHPELPDYYTSIYKQYANDIELCKICPNQFRVIT